MAEPGLKSQLEAIRTQLKNERTPWESTLKELDKHVLPDRCQWTETEQGQPSKTGFGYLLDDMPVRAIRTCASGLLTGLTNPARVWFDLELGDSPGDAPANVQLWLEDSRDRMLRAFARSNLYNVLPITYGNAAAFGFDAVVMQEDDEEIFRFESLAIGTYWMSTNAKRRVDCLVREVRMSARQIVEDFKAEQQGMRNVSATVAAAYADASKREQQFTVVHVVCRNAAYNPRGILAKEKRYLSAYYETDGATTDERFLSLSGFDDFPALCPRWETTGRNAYGQGPGKQILGHAKALQAYKRAIDKGTAKKADPPLLAPSRLMGKAITQVPGGITYYDEATGGAPTIQPLYDVQTFDTAAVFALVEDTRRQIREATFADLFMMISNSDRRQITAEEIRARQEEKILQLGPVLENLNDELLDPLINRCFNSMFARGMLAPPPPEIQGARLTVRYASTLAQVQKMLGLGAMDRLLGTIGNIAGKQPDVIDNYDLDQVAREYHDMLGVTHRILRPEQEREALRQARAKAQQAAAATELQTQQAETAKLLSETDTNRASALTDLIDAASGAA